MVDGRRHDHRVEHGTLPLLCTYVDDSSLMQVLSFSHKCLIGLYTTLRFPTDSVQAQTRPFNPDHTRTTSWSLDSERTCQSTTFLMIKS